MSTSFECKTCHYSFTIKKFNKNLRCPFCGSGDLFVKPVDYLISVALLKKLILVELILVVIVLTIFILTSRDLKISSVDINKKNNSISVTLNSASLKRRVEYSFNSGKTYQNNRNFYVQQPGTYIIVVRDNKNRKDVWNIPITFSKEDLNAMTGPVRFQPPHIKGVEPVNETVKGKNDGKIIIHAIDGKKPIKYSIDGGNTLADDSIFINLSPGSYNVRIIDDASYIENYFEPINLSQGLPAPEPHTKIKPPSRFIIESKLNRLFAEPDNTLLRDSIQGYFINLTMNVDCELVDIPPNTPYQLYQFLQRRYEGQPGTKRIQVLDLGYDNMKHINKLRVKETRVSVNN